MTENPQPLLARSSGVEEVWAVIAHDLELLLGLVLHPVIALALLAEPVLALEHEVHEDGSAEEEQELVGEHDAVAGPVPGLLLLGVDVGGNNTVHVAPADDDTDHDTALQRAFDVVGRPGQGVGDGGVDADGAEESTCVLDVHIVGGEKHGETDAADERDDHVAVTTPLGAVGNETDDNSHGGGNGVGRNGHELGLGAGVAHTEKNGGKEEGEAVQRAKAAHVDDSVAPGLPVLERSVNVAAVDVANGGTGLTVSAETTESAELLISGEEGGGVGEVEGHPPAHETDTDGHETLDDENPAPSRVATDSVHVGDGSGEKTTEGTSKRGSGEKHGGTETEFLALVPAREVVVDTGKETSLSDTKEPAASEKTSLVLDNTHERHNEAPGEDNAGEKDARRPPLDQNVGEGLETSVRDEEDGEGIVVVATAHAKVRLHESNTRITDVCSVQEAAKQ